MRLLKDVDGHRFMPDYEPEKKELGVARCRLAAHGRAHRKGKGVSRDSATPLLDITLLRAPHQTQPARGLRDLHYFSASIRSRIGSGAARAALHHGRSAHNHTGESPTLKDCSRQARRLCGNACFNRLGGNSVPRRWRRHDRGEFIATFARGTIRNIPTGVIEETLRRSRQDRRVDRRPRTKRRCNSCRMQTLMTNKVAISAPAKLWKSGTRTATAIVAQPQYRLRYKRERQSRTGDAYRCKRCSRWRCVSPTARSSERKAARHFAMDFPRRNDASG